MGSFRFKLVAYFVLLALVPLGAAAWGLHAFAERSETRGADLRLESGLRFAEGAYSRETYALTLRLERLSRSPALRAALRDRDRERLAAVAAGVRHTRIVGAGGAVGGSVPRHAVVQSTSIFDGPRRLGTVVTWFPVDDAFVLDVARRAGLLAGDSLVFVRDGRIRAGAPELAGAPVSLRPGAAAVERVRGRDYRVHTSARLGADGAALAMLSPQAAVGRSARSSELTLALAVAGLLALVGILAYALSRSIVRTLARLARGAEEIASGRLGARVPERGSDEFAHLARAFNEMADQLEGRLGELEAERTRLRRATARIGEALSASHDVNQLLAVVVETAVEATGAVGGAVRTVEGRERWRFGAGPAAGGETLEVPLRAGRRSYGTLVLNGPGFGQDERVAAASLAQQALVALENARLHRLVARQAVVDELTGLANRRALEQTLRAEVARSQRFNGDVAVVLCDLDDFKLVNDRHGHPAGDLVLREFGRRLRRALREVDHAGRWGGEEFCLILPRSDAEGAELVAERARALVERRPFVLPGGEEIAVTASFGVASLAASGDESGLVDAADAALYEAKRTGKNRVVTSASRAVAA
jgi:diguanylate cyclase (GGDEF)-like protein